MSSVQENARSGAITARPLSDALGAEVCDVDLAKVTDEDVAAIRDIWHDNLVILFRGQDLSEAAQVAFGPMSCGRGTAQRMQLGEPRNSSDCQHVTQNR